MGWLNGKATGLAPPIYSEWRALPELTGNLEGVMYPGGESYGSYARNGYKRNEVLFSCIRERGQSLAQSTIRVYPSSAGSAAVGEPDNTHPLRRLLARPNPNMTEPELVETTLLHLDLAGNAFWRIVRGRNGLPAELWPLRPDLVQVAVGVDRIGRPAFRYLYTPTGTSSVIPIDPDDVVHYKYPNPDDEYVGMPPIQAAARAASLDNGATDFVDDLLRNHAVPGTVILNQAAIDQPTADRVQRRWIASFGKGNRGKPAVLQQGMDVKTLGHNLRDLEFPDLRTISETRICMVYGVPGILIGTKAGMDRSTFANYGEARRSFWEETLMPLQRGIADVIQHRLLPQFPGARRGEEIAVRWDNAEVLALRESETERTERVTNAFVQGLVTRNEARQTLGREPVDGGDVFVTPAGVLATDPTGRPLFAEATEPPPAARSDDNAGDDDA